MKNAVSSILTSLYTIGIFIMAMSLLSIEINFKQGFVTTAIAVTGWIIREIYEARQ